MFPYYVALDGFDLKMGVAGDAPDEPGCVQDAACAEDVSVRQAHDPVALPGQNIHRVGYDDDRPVAVIWFDLIGDVPDDVDVVGDHVETGLSYPPVSSCGDDDEVALLAVFVSARPDFRDAHIRDPVLDIERFTDGLLLIDVDQDDLPGEIGDGKRIGNRGADIAGAYDHYPAMGYFRCDR